MHFANSFYVAAEPQRTWLLLQDVPTIAPCIPGARLTQVLESDRFRGEAAVKLGPVQLEFEGEARLTLTDPAAHKARVVAKGADRRGRGNASAIVDFTLMPEGSGTRVNVDTDLNLAGTVAQYGRASGLVNEIANQILSRFADNLRTLILQAPPSGLPLEHLVQVPQAAASNAALPGFKILFVATAQVIKRTFARLLGRSP